MKTYNSPMLQVVGIKQNDIIVTSPGYGGTTNLQSGNLGADRFREDWDAGY